MEEISWTDRVENEEVLHEAKEERNIMHTTEKKGGVLTGLVPIFIGNAF